MLPQASPAEAEDSLWLRSLALGTMDDATDVFDEPALEVRAVAGRHPAPSSSLDRLCFQAHLAPLCIPLTEPITKELVLASLVSGLWLLSLAHECSSLVLRQRLAPFWPMRCTQARPSWPFWTI